MLNQRVDAIYENGVLRPLAPLDLAEHQRVSLIVGTGGDDEQDPDGDEYMPLIVEEADPSITLEQVQAALAKLPSSLAEDFDRERDERF